MANKALAKRQKMVIRLEPSQKAPRNPFALAANKRVAGAHQPSKASQRPNQQTLLKKIISRTNNDED